ncbi:MAG: hypothetical protein H6959_04525 [Chromatiaceae bacterium]|nr:hypothetical protein [Chromatiaceae bacterium]MCP5422158.1 hypothetical protein [Chromatiaceae bacterium]
MRRTVRHLFVIVLVSLLSIAAHARSIKCWTDEDGNTACGDAVPPKVVNKGYRVLNDRGMEVKREERALTPEELERQRALAALRAEQQKLLEEQQERDRTLLNLYQTENDLLMARDGKIAQIESQIRLNHNEIRRLKTRLSDFQASAAQAERSGKRLSKTQEANLDSTQRSIERSYAIILSKEDEKRETLEHYDYDLERFRKLNNTGARAAATERTSDFEFPDLVDTAVHCTDSAACGRIWEAAQGYARKNATTAVDLAAERILVTAPPRNLHDISITVSRLEDRDGGGERIFMDVQCANFTEGRDFCRGAEVQRIRDNFKPALGIGPPKSSD